MLFYEKIHQTLPNKSHGPMYCKIGDTCVDSGHVFYTRYVITRQSNPPISQFNSLCNWFTSLWSMFVYNNFLYNSVVIVCVYFQIWRKRIYCSTRLQSLPHISKLLSKTLCITCQRYV